MQLKILRAGYFISFIFLLQTSNHAPLVKFTQPQNKNVYNWNTLLPYAVEITDAEDGDSKYQEIPPSEVLIKLKYVENNTEATAYLKQKKTGDTTGVLSMLISNCFNCHAVKTKMAGPSFQEISKKYKPVINSNNQLVDHILKGSVGIWGKEVMPTHPELSEVDCRRMVQWILKYSDDPGLNFYAGIQGSLPLNKPSPATRQGLFIITAYYTDHGTRDFPGKRLTSSDRIIVQMRPN